MRVPSGSRGLLALALVAVAVARSASAAEEPIALEPGMTVQRLIEAEQVDRYRISVGPGDAAIVEVAQDGADVAVRSSAGESDYFWEPELGPESIVLLGGGEPATAVEVRAGTATCGRYEIRVRVQAATEHDRTRFEAQKELLAARRLRDPERPESVQEAIRHGENALRLWLSVDDDVRAAAALHRIGSDFQLLRDHAAARARYEAALALLTRLEMQWDIGQIHLKLGWLEDNLGNYQSALDHYHQALSILNQYPRTTSNLAAVHASIGLAHASLGDRRKALENYEASLALYRELPPQAPVAQRGEAIVQFDIGQLHADARDWDEALAQFNRALATFRRLQSTRREAQTLAAIARVHGIRGDAVTALEMFESAQRLATDRRLKAILLDEIGELHLRQGRFPEALRAYRAALELQRATGERAKAAVSLHGIARAEHQAGNHEAALAASEECLALIGAIRDDVGSRDLRLSFRAATGDYYETHIDILMALHEKAPSGSWAMRALEASENGRARVLVEALQQRAAPPGPADAAHSLNTLDSHARASVRDDRLEAGRADFESFSLARLAREILDPETVLLEYALGTRRSFVWVVTGNGVKSVHPLPGRATVERAAREVHRLLSAGPNRRNRYDLERAAQELARLILPKQALRTNAKRLVIVPDGALHYVPFSALPLGKERRLLDAYEIAVAPSASTLLLLRDEPRTRERTVDYDRAIRVIADPVFSPEDPRLRQVAQRSRRREVSGDVARAAAAGERLARLPATRAEAEAIRRLAANVRIAAGFDATREMLFARETADAAIVHIATHALVDSDQPERSRIVLSLLDRDGRPLSGYVRADEIHSLPLDNTELVVLSACRTALGKELRGEGIVGLLRGFMQAGAPRVVATYWDVRDRATAELMSRFYRALLQDGLSPAAALRRAQLALRSDPRWESPYYWAAFGLHGEWR